MKKQFSKGSALNLVFLVVLSAAWFGIGWLLRDRTLSPDILLIEQVRQHLLSDYPFALPESRELTYAAISGILKRSGDTHAALLTPELSVRYRDDFAGQSGVIGLAPEVQNGQVVATVVFPGEPAAEAGLKEGDIILSVDGVSFDENTTSAEAALLVRGPVGKPARIAVQRGKDVLTFEPVRKPRTIVSSKMLAGQIGYIAQYTFTQNSPQEFQKALETILAQNPKGLVWDLRSNGGGSMEAAQTILSFFIGDGLLFSVEGKDGKQTDFPAKGNPLASKIPLVVLVGARTYSAAEASASAIQERKRGIVMGAVTFGKGTVQATVPLVDNCLLQFTIAKWLSPSGKWYEKIGVTPDIAVNDGPATAQDEVLEAAMNYLK
jgi:carboxyl-terminal processing protease